MKPDFFVARATSKTFKIFCLCSEGHLTFREDRIIQIATKFQSKIPLLRTVAVTDTISWSGGFPQRKSFTFLQRSWNRKAAVDVNTFPSALTSEIGTENRSVDCYCYNYLYIIWLLSLLLLLSRIKLIIGFTCPPTIHFKFITKCDSIFITKCEMYNKVRQFYYKVRQNKRSSSPVSSLFAE